MKREMHQLTPSQNKVVLKTVVQKMWDTIASCKTIQQLDNAVKMCLFKYGEIAHFKDVDISNLYAHVLDFSILKGKKILTDKACDEVRRIINTVE